MEYEELLEKYQALLNENSNLRKEIKSLRANQIAAEQRVIRDRISEAKSSFRILKQEPSENNVISNINSYSDPLIKIKLFMSLFKGRNNVYATRVVNKKGETYYPPVCLNIWKPGICGKPKMKCANCSQKKYAALDEKVIAKHLKGAIIAGIYPLLPDETCYFLAIDFDGDGWQKDVLVLREVCHKFSIPIAVERSRSGEGAHVWFFFEKPIPAIQARKLGTSLITYSMNKRHEINFKSYDRFFPNQDTMPKGRLGNLIALPLQKMARAEGNSVFIDEDFKPIPDQWEFLANIKKLTADEVEMYISKLFHGNELGVLKKDDENNQKPWETTKVQLEKNDFPEEIEVVKANMLFLNKSGISPKGLNYLKRLAAFKNPEFYRAQAMRLPTFNKPRVISCSDETEKYLCLPRGCEADLKELFKKLEINNRWIDKTNLGRKIDVEFKGKLWDEQTFVINELLKYENGVLSGTTAFGKTVVAIKLIAERKVNTLILVNRIQLLSQWKDSLEEFLNINESLPEINQDKKAGRKRKRSVIGQIGGGKNDLTGIIDVGVMQSLNRKGEVNDCVKNYGLVIIDECHHISAFSFEQILKSTNAKYVYGLTATPTRKDGHHPIIFMQCGPIRYSDDAKKQAEKRPFNHFIIPRFTPFKVPLDKIEKDITIQELYSEIVDNEMRNQLIVNDVVKCFESGRNCIVLTERTAHVDILTKKISEKVFDVISLTGGMGRKETREILTKIVETPPDKQLTLVATGKYIGEGFDEPRLDTLFLAMPISWKGTLHQYAGRLHRLFENKKEVQIYDYVDVHVRMLEKMYSKRLTGYASIGYKVKGDLIESESIDIIFDKSNFLPVYSNDIVNAQKEILIVSPYITKRRTLQMLEHLKVALENKVRVVVVTKPVEDYKNRSKATIEKTISILKNTEIKIVTKSNLYQKFSVVDQRILWYGSINLLSFGGAKESIMRLENSYIVSELMESIEDEVL